MSSRPSDILFQLIHSLEKAEKRHFKLYIKRSSSNENLKIVQLFDAVDKLKTYNEQELLKKLPGIQKAQLHNLKTHLYKQILSSLRLLKSADSVDLQLHEQFDYAHILYKKGLFYQSLRILDKVKEMAVANQKLHFLTLVLGLEKRIESQNITKDIQENAKQLALESQKVSRHIDHVTKLSNLALQLYSWHVKQGPVRNEGEETSLRTLLNSHLPVAADYEMGFYEQMYLYQSYTWYALLHADFLTCFKYAQKWVNLFHQNPLMKRVETSHYIKGLHYLLNVHFELLNYRRFMTTLAELETFSKTERVQENDNFRIQTFIYLAQARLNLFFMKGDFKEGKLLVQEIEQQLQENALFIDKHRILVLNYKIALFHFANRDYSACIDYAQKIINDAVDLRVDLQGNARLLHLLAHFEEGNSDLMDSLSKSVQRFISKSRELTFIEKELFRLLRQTPALSKTQFRQQLSTFIAQQKGIERFLHPAKTAKLPYLLIWIKSKVENKTIDFILQENFQLQNKNRLKEIV